MAAAVAAARRLPGGPWGPLRPCRAAGKVLGATRGIRAGFFPEDPDWIDPEGPLLAERLGSRWRHMDDASLSAPILERSNVGMGMLVLNRPRGLDLPMINDLYVRLRNLEVNTLKRFVGLTSMDPGPFCLGLDPRELLLAATSASRTGWLPRFSRALLWHRQELAHLVADYRKPIVCQMSGPAAGGGAALACLASFGGAHEASEVSVDSVFSGIAPDGGITYVLGQLRWHLGEFMALTGWPVRGSDLVYAGLVRHWLSPDALPFLELTSEKQLEMSEEDGRKILREHSLPLPDGLRPGDSLPREILPLVAAAFSRPSVPEIVEALKEMQMDRRKAAQAFADECLLRMKRASPLALHVTLHLVREARQGAARARAARAQQGGQRAPEEAVGQHPEDGDLAEQLQLELRAQQRLLAQHDAVVGLHAKCLGREVQAPDWSRRSFLDVTREDVNDIVRPSNPEAGEAEEFAIGDRSDFTLSQHPRLRRYHPDFDPRTQLDHDPAWMAAEAKRWSPELFADERQRAIENLLGGQDPAQFGLSRFAGRP